MGQLFLFILLIFTNKIQAHDHDHNYKMKSIAEPPHLDHEMSSQEYQALLDIHVAHPNTVTTPEDAEIEQWLGWGKRTLQWVDLVNDERSEENKISLSSPETQTGNPTSNPRIYNFKIIKDSWVQLQKDMPRSLRDVIWGTSPLSSHIPISENDFVKWLLEVDRAYQLSARYKLRKPWQLFMSGDANRDVRGFLNLKNDKNINQKLSTWNTLNQNTKKQLTADLSQICINSGEFAIDCSDQLNKAIRQNTVVSFKNRYMPAGQKNYDRFFLIVQKRTDIVWPQNQPNLMILPFRDPQDSQIFNFLKDNIEDEWRLGSWKLNLNFIINPLGNTAYVRFIPGATPNVNGLAGSIITMDANTPLTEYNAQWTIRHEFGHVLGFPDCYHEFYDNSLSAFVSYQLDLNDVMCSRRGKLLQRHFNELKRVYFPTK